MKTKLTPDICYIAGLQSKSRETEVAAVGIVTSREGVEQRFIEIAVKELGIKPERILIEKGEEEGAATRVYFYHSKVAKTLREIIGKETYLFKAKNDLSKSYVAGMFDASGHVKGGVRITGLTPKDEVMLANLGVHTRGGKVYNISSLVELIKGRSIMFGDAAL